MNTNPAFRFGSRRTGAKAVATFVLTLAIVLAVGVLPVYASDHFYYYYSGTEGGYWFDTGWVTVYSSSSYDADEIYVRTNTCAGLGLTTEYNGLHTRTGQMRVSGYTPGYPTSCEYSVNFIGKYYSTVKSDGEHHFVVTFNNANESPNDISLSSNALNEGAAAGAHVGSFGYSDPDVAEGYGGGTYSFSLVGGDTGSFYVAGSGLYASTSFNYEARSSYSVTARVTDPTGLTYDEAFTIYVNNVLEPPVIANAKPSALAVLEDGSQTLSVSATDPDNGALSYAVTIAPLYGTAGFSGNVVTYTPGSNFYGADSLQVRVTDSGGQSDDLAVNVTVRPVNDQPAFTKGGDQTATEDGGLQSVGGWATGLSKGPANEGPQTLTFVTSSDNPALFATAPAIASDGTLTFRPAANAHGSATVSVYLTDDGGVADGGVDTTAQQTFTITVNPVNDAPAFNTAGSPTIATVAEDDTANPGMLVSALIATGANGAPITDVDDDAAEGVGLGLAIIGVDNTHGTWQYSTNGGGAWSDFGSPSAAAARLLAADANTRIRFVPGENWNGTVNPAVTFRAWDQAPGSGDNGGTASIDSAGTGFTTAFSAEYEFASLIVAAVNDAPLLDNAGQTVLDPILEDQAANVGTSVAALIDSAGGDRITEVANEITPVEGIAVTAVDNANGAWQFSIDNGATWTAFGTPGESDARLLASTTATKVRFVPDLNWSLNWDLAVTPEITFRAWDQTGGVNGGTADIASTGGTTPFSTQSETATISITSLNDAPTFVKGADQVLDEGAPAQTLTNWATAISPGPADEVAQGQAVNFSVVYVTAPELFLVQPGLSPDGTLTYTPDPEAFGEATVIFELHDTGGTLSGGIDTSPYGFFTITLNGVNDAPTFSKGGDQVVDEDSGLHVVDGWATAISRGPANEDWQDLTFVLTADRPELFADGPGLSATGQLSYTLAANANGQATISVQLYDGGGTQFNGANASTIQAFALQVNALNDAPVNTTPPQIDGLPFVNEALSATTGVWNDAIDRAPGALIYTYQWQRASDAQGTGLLDIADASGATYTLTPADAGQYVRVRVTATDDGEGTPTSQNTAAASLFTRVGIVNTNVTVTDFVRTTTEDTPLSVGATDFTAAYTHASAASLTTLRITGLPVSGTLTLNATPIVFGQEIPAADLDSLIYTPAANWTGPDVFHWTATEDAANAGYPLPGLGAAVTITTEAVNDAPVLVLPGAFSVAEGGLSAPQTFQVTDPDSPYVVPASAEYTLSLQAGQGTLTLATWVDLIVVDGADGTSAVTLRGTLAALNAALNGVRYQPVDGFAGLDVLELMAFDAGSAGAGEPLTDAQTLEVFVVEVNNAPTQTLPADFVLERDTTSGPLVFSVDDDARTTVEFTLAASAGRLTLATTANLTRIAGADGSALMTYRGTLTRVNAALNGVRYQPPTGFHGPIEVTLTTNDLGATGSGGALSDTDRLTIVANATPILVADTWSASVNDTITVAAPGVLANDSDLDNDPLTAQIVSPPAAGTLSLEPNGAFVYTPALNQQGAVTFTYRVSDGILTTAPMTATLNFLKAYPTLALVAAPAEALIGQAVALTATVTGLPEGVVPTGTANFSVDGQPSAVQSLTGGIGRLDVGTLGLGTHTVTATYSGDDTYWPATSLDVSVTITNTLPPGGQVNGGVISGTITNQGTLVDVTVYTDTIVTGGMISGTVTNNGQLVDVTVDADAVITGGLISGTVTNNGQLVDVTIGADAVITGGLISGTVTNNGQLVNPRFGPNARVTGGALSGAVTGTAGAPAFLHDLRVNAGAVLQDVILGPNVILEPDVELLGGVQLWYEVTAHGTGSGAVTSAPAGIACGTDPEADPICAAAFDWTAPVTLTAIAAPNTTFVGWSGACTGTGDCVVPGGLRAAQAITAEFALKTYQLQIRSGGVGAGVVLQSPSGATLAHGTVVTLTAVADAGSVFVGWEGAVVSEQNPITLTIEASTEVTAVFKPAIQTVYLPILLQRSTTTSNAAASRTAP